METDEGGKPREQSDEGTENRQDPEGGGRETRDEGMRRDEFCGTNGQASRWNEREKKEGSREDGLPVLGLGAPP